MTRWYAYRWICVACNAIHYYDAGSLGCGRCGKNEFRQEVNNAYAVERLTGKKPTIEKKLPTTDKVEEPIEELPAAPTVTTPKRRKKKKPQANKCNIDEILKSYDDLMKY